MVPFYYYAKCFTVLDQVNGKVKKKQLFSAVLKPMGAI